MSLPHTHTRGLVIWPTMGKSPSGVHWHILGDAEKPYPGSPRVTWGFPTVCGNKIEDAVAVMPYHLLNLDVATICEACFYLHNQKAGCPVEE